MYLKTKQEENWRIGETDYCSGNIDREASKTSIRTKKTIGGLTAIKMDDTDTYRKEDTYGHRSRQTEDNWKMGPC